MLETVLAYVLLMGVPADFPISASYEVDGMERVHAYTTCAFRNGVVQSCKIEFNWASLGDRHRVMKHEACHVAIWYRHGQGIDPHGKEFEACMKAPL